MKQLLKEDKFDFIVRKLVKDIISVVKHQKEGEFGLPEDLSSEDIFYSFPNLDTEFSVFLDLQLDETVDTVDVDGDYYPDDELIYVTIKTNPLKQNQVLQELIGELNELIRHELEHIKQHEEGYEFPEDTTDPEKYYSQEHEIQAQRKGFMRRAKKEDRRFEEVIRTWFDRNKQKHNLKPEQIEIVIKKILSSV